MSLVKPGMRAGHPSVRKAAQTLSDFADKPDFVRINFDISRDLHKKLKIHAVETGQTVSDILRELVQEKLADDMGAK